MRIVGFVCYFLILFYGVELVVEELTIEEPAISSPVKSKVLPIKETVENSRVCVYYPTYKSCTDLPKN
ncbi:hypothetical protein U1P98_03550 [Lysinibacillus irui]|uniref:Uncharacterized protein n=1 Tax=Lysinibacillus irui TaxID=2998077 RepID=A0AAJ5RLE2_9BACI|nr:MULTISPECIES: hypothetical protein [Lysinibacillus]MEA0552783.1 hypothetical protein [Lysinibacillus irui]MEA0565943.1 hypothetical protein [Lysinibacillus irui]MEA0975363.1 hypothetical protein [Lysinibacillus irui]MEA1041517.1 hypothetical protein [Lysinibacillus irui]WDV05165.1 hypothetical protein OU989_12675 [Lysinibacillus irui]